MSSDPIELAAIDRGAGTPVALVHGGVFHGAPAWARQIGPLAESGYRAIAVDRRGHGRSEAGSADFIPVHLHADDLRLTLELRDAKKVHLVGVSYGALVCLEFALSWPDRTISMTLLEPPLFTWLQGDPDYEVWFERFEEIGKKRASMRLEEWLPEWMGLIDSRMAKELTPGSPLWPTVESQAPLIFKEEAGWQYQPNPSAIGAMGIEVLVVNGDQSEPAMHAIGELASERIPNARHAWIHGGGHDSHARKPEEFNRLLIDFIDRNDPEIQ